MGDLFNEIKENFGFKFCIVFFAIIFLFSLSESNKYKSLIESLVNLKIENFFDFYSGIGLISVYWVIYSLIFIFSGSFINKKINDFLSLFIIKNSSLKKSIENIICKFEFSGKDIGERIKTQEYYKSKLKEEIDPLLKIKEISGSFLIFGFFFVFISYNCGFLDFVFGVALVFVSLILKCIYFLKVLKIAPKYIAAEVILNKSKLDNSIRNFF